MDAGHRKAALERGIPLVIGTTGLSAEFLGAVQLLIYVGAITTMVVFAVMLSNVRELTGEESKRRFWAYLLEGRVLRRAVLPLIVALGFLAAMIRAYSSTEWPAMPGEPAGSNTRSIGEALFGGYVVPFELASLVLLAALIGSIALAAREKQTSERKEDKR